MPIVASQIKCHSDSLNWAAFYSFLSQFLDKIIFLFKFNLI